MKDIIYESVVTGKQLNLSKDPYWLEVESLFDYAWNYSTRAKRRGNEILGFSRPLKEQDLTMYIFGRTVEEMNSAIDSFNALIEQDIAQGVPGKLKIGDWYTQGYIFASTNSKWSYGAPFIKKELVFARSEQNWYRIIKKQPYLQIEESSTETLETGIKDYENGYDYSYDYKNSISKESFFVNTSLVPCDFVVSIQGYCNSPEIQIGSTVVHVDVEVPDQAVLTVNSIEKTIILTYPDGSTENCFGLRDSEYYIFQRISPGRNIISWSGGFSWELQVLEERSEPEWSTI